MNKHFFLQSWETILLVLFLLVAYCPVTALAADGSEQADTEESLTVTVSADEASNGNSPSPNAEGNSANSVNQNVSTGSDLYTGASTDDNSILPQADISDIDHTQGGGIGDPASGTDRRGGGADVEVDMTDRNEYPLQNDSKAPINPVDGTVAGDETAEQTETHGETASAESDNNTQNPSTSTATANGGSTSEFVSAKHQTIDPTILKGITETEDDLTVIIDDIKLVIPGAALADIETLDVSLSLTESGRLTIGLTADGEAISGFEGYPLDVYIPWDTDTYEDYYCIDTDGNAANALSLENRKLHFEIVGAGSYTIVSPASPSSETNVPGNGPQSDENMIKTAVLGMPLIGALGISVVRRRKDHQE